MTTRPKRGEPGYVRQVRRVTSEYPGIRYITARKQWRAKIKINGINYIIGFYDKETDAAEAYKTTRLAWDSGVDVTTWGMSNVLD